MAYVSVPVPEELVPEVLRYVLRLMKPPASQRPLDVDAVRTLYEESDELSRSVLSFVGRATLAERDMTAADLAKRIEIRIPETTTLVRELNARCGEMGVPPIIDRLEVERSRPNGRPTALKVMVMQEAVARMVRDVERGEQPAADDGPE